MLPCARKSESFAFETTLAGLAYLGRIGQWRKQGYHASLFFLRLPDAETAIARVAERVLQGGHHIAENVIRRRFAAGQHNFEHVYKGAVNVWADFDNVGAEPTLLQWRENE